MARFEAWTNAELDKHPHWAAQHHPYYSRTLTNPDGTPLDYRGVLPTGEQNARQFIKEADERKATDSRAGKALARYENDPIFADAFKSIAGKEGRPTGPVISPFITNFIDLQVKELKKVIKQIWVDGFGKSNRREDNPPNAADIILKRFRKKYEINLDPYKIGATLVGDSVF